jgi:hypothetical protein
VVYLVFQRESTELRLVCEPEDDDEPVRVVILPEPELALAA